jgi:uncharacterized protein YpuA (DUF1002 family)
MDQFKEKIEEIVKKVKEDDSFAAKFKENPVEAVESVIGVDLPDDKINSIIDTVKAKISGDELKDKLSGIGDKVKGLFN